MKQVLTFAFTIFVAVLLTACKKDYTCTCSTDGVIERHVIQNVKKSHAEDECHQRDAVEQLQGGSCTLN